MAGTDFGGWQKEKAVKALIDEAQAIADRLASAKPHAREMHAAAVQFWAVSCLGEGQDLAALASWKPAAVAQFIRSAQTRIAALRKARDYTSSDGLAVWLHVARSLSEPRLTPPLREIWAHLAATGQNVEAMLADLLLDAGLPPAAGPRRMPPQFAPET